MQLLLCGRRWHPTLRLKGDYLAIATLGVSEIIRILIMNGGDLTNGADLSGIVLTTGE